MSDACKNTNPVDNKHIWALFTPTCALHIVISVDQQMGVMLSLSLSQEEYPAPIHAHINMDLTLTVSVKLTLCKPVLKK